MDDAELPRMQAVLVGGGGPSAQEKDGGSLACSAMIAFTAAPGRDEVERSELADELAASTTTPTL